MTHAELDRLAALAAAASADEPSPGYWFGARDVEKALASADITMTPSADAAYIAACSPEVVARLVGLAREAVLWRAIVDVAREWRELRREYEALSASVQERFKDLGRPPGFSAWNEDERKRHTWLLGEMLVKLHALEASIDMAT